MSAAERGMAAVAQLVTEKSDALALARSTIEAQQRTMDAMAAQHSMAINATLDQAALACERRADSVRDGAAVARQCAADIRAKKLPGAHPHAPHRNVNADEDFPDFDQHGWPNEIRSVLLNVADDAVRLRSLAKLSDGLQRANLERLADSLEASLPPAETYIATHPHPVFTTGGAT